MILVLFNPKFILSNERNVHSLLKSVYVDEVIFPIKFSRFVKSAHHWPDHTFSLPYRVENGKCSKSLLLTVGGSL